MRDFEGANLWQLLNDVQVEGRQHRIQCRQRLLPLLEQFLLQRVDVEEVVLVDLGEGAVRGRDAALAPIRDSRKFKSLILRLLLRIVELNRLGVTWALF